MLQLMLHRPPFHLIATVHRLVSRLHPLRVGHLASYWVDLLTLKGGTLAYLLRFITVSLANSAKLNTVNAMD